MYPKYWILFHRTNLGTAINNFTHQLILLTKSLNVKI